MAATATLVGRMAWDDSQLTRGLRNSEKSLAKFGKSIKTAVAAFAGFASIRSATGFLKTSIDAFLEEETAIRKFEGALRASGEEVTANTTKMRELATAMQRQTIHADDAVIGMGQLALSMGVTTDKMEEAIKGAIGLSAAFGVSETTAIKMASSALQGKFTMLSRYIPALKTATDDAEKMAIVQRAMADGFKIAQAEADAGAGKIARLKNEWGDLKESIGERLAPGLISAMGELKPIITFMVEGFIRAYHVAGAIAKLFQSFTASLVVGFEAHKAALAKAFGDEKGYEEGREKVRAAVETMTEYKAGADESWKMATDPNLFREQRKPMSSAQAMGEAMRLGPANWIGSPPPAMKPEIQSGTPWSRDAAPTLEAMLAAQLSLQKEFVGIRADLQANLYVRQTR